MSEPKFGPGRICYAYRGMFMAKLPFAWIAVCDIIKKSSPSAQTVAEEMPGR